MKYISFILLFYTSITMAQTQPEKLLLNACEIEDKLLMDNFKNLFELKSWENFDKQLIPFIKAQDRKMSEDLTFRQILQKEHQIIKKAFELHTTKSINNEIALHSTNNLQGQEFMPHEEKLEAVNIKTGERVPKFDEIAGMGYISTPNPEYEIYYEGPHTIQTSKNISMKDFITQISKNNVKIDKKLLEKYKSITLRQNKNIQTNEVSFLVSTKDMKENISTTMDPLIFLPGMRNDQCKKVYQLFEVYKKVELSKNKIEEERNVLEKEKSDIQKIQNELGVKPE